ncbi:MAG: ABC transporter ATP-binding protein/permease [Bifidobacterium sp.]|jgi:ATP-binding cassette subfamily B protein|nr:ABC transporter ATP-binding protein/permease [Bifidobacterium sp.]
MTATGTPPGSPTLEFTKKAKQQPREAAKARKRHLADMLQPVQGATHIAIACQAVASLCTILPFVAITQIANALIAGRSGFLGHGAPITDVHAAVWSGIWLALGGLAGRAVFSMIALGITHFADARMGTFLRRRIVKTLSHAPLGWFTSHSSGLVRKAAIDDIASIHYLVAHASVETTGAVCTPIFALIYLFALDWRLAALSIVPIPIYGLAYAYMAKDWGAMQVKVNVMLQQISEAAIEFVSGISAVKTFGRTGQAHRKYRDTAQRLSAEYNEYTRPMIMTDAIASVSIMTPVVLVLGLAGGFWMMRLGWVNATQVFGASLVAATLPSALITVSYGMQSRTEASAAALRIHDLLETKQLPAPNAPTTPQDNTVIFDHVDFSYTPGSPVLHGISLELRPGTVTALVGPSGSGKSTLATLLPRFFDPERGCVRIGGVDVRDIEPAELYRHVGFVLQDVQLVHLSIADNIRLGRPSVTLDKVRDVARLAQIDERIEQLPRGYDSVVGEDAMLSGGEAQRVSIARALLADPPILVLDEATAFADPESETAIQLALSQLTAGRTLLVIAHRLATIAGADQIAVMKDGRIVEQGTQDELVAAGGLYSSMWREYEGAGR